MSTEVERINDRVPISAKGTAVDDPSYKGLLSLDPLRTKNAEARNAFRAYIRRFLPLAFFFLFVVIPVVAIAIYTTVLATSRYTAEFRFSIRGWDAPAIEQIGGVIGLAGGSGAGGLVLSNSYIVTAFLQSRDAIEAIRPTVDPLALYSSESIDFFARYRGPDSIDAFVPYWRRHVVAAFDPLTGIVTAQVEAMSPQDALAITRALKTAVDNLVNRLSNQAREEALGRSQQDVERQADRLREARVAIQTFRNANRVVDPSKEIEGLMNTIREMEANRAVSQAEIDAQSALMSPNAPAIQVRRARTKALTDQIRLAEERLASTNEQARSLASVLTRFQELEIQQQIAEKAYGVSLEALDRARRDAERRQIYLASFVEPRVPEVPSFPTPFKSILLTLGIGLCLCLITSVVTLALLDRSIAR
jgi:capsular polysaccharide transport system permease protein